VGQEKLRRDPFERRTVWVLALTVAALVFPSTGLRLVGAPDWWTVALFVAGNAALVLAVAGAGLALMPTRAQLPAAIRRRTNAELLSLAIAFLWLGLALVFVNYSILAIDAIGEPDF
jgi:hypothetical protein